MIIYKNINFSSEENDKLKIDKKDLDKDFDYIVISCEEKYGDKYWTVLGYKEEGDD